MVNFNVLFFFLLIYTLSTPPHPIYAFDDLEDSHLLQQQYRVTYKKSLDLVCTAPSIPPEKWAALHWTQAFPTVPTGKDTCTFYIGTGKSRLHPFPGRDGATFKWVDVDQKHPWPKEINIQQTVVDVKSKTGICRCTKCGSDHDVLGKFTNPSPTTPKCSLFKANLQPPTAVSGNYQVMIFTPGTRPPRWRNAHLNDWYTAGYKLTASISPKNNNVNQYIAQKIDKTGKKSYLGSAISQNKAGSLKFYFGEDSEGELWIDPEYNQKVVQYQVLVGNFRPEFEWITVRSQDHISSLEYTVDEGADLKQEITSVCRIYSKEHGTFLVGKLSKESRKCIVAYKATIITQLQNYDVLTNPERLKVSFKTSNFPPKDAVQNGHEGELWSSVLYIGKGMYMNTNQIGVIDGLKKEMYISYKGKVVKLKKFKYMIGKRPKEVKVRVDGDKDHGRDKNKNPKSNPNPNVAPKSDDNSDHQNAYPHPPVNPKFPWITAPSQKPSYSPKEPRQPEE